MDTRRHYFLAIDGGGTHTRIRIESASGVKIIERAVPYSCKYFSFGFPEAAKRVARLIETTAAKKRIPMTTITGVCIGLAGNGNERDKKVFRQYLKKAFAAAGLKPSKFLLDTDAAIALEGLLAGGAGVVLICGTGAIVLGKSAANIAVRIGGWGHAVGDEGSGYWIGLRGLNAITRSLDGRAPRTELSDAVFNAFPVVKKRDPGSLRSAIASGKIAIEQIAPLVSYCANRGDAAAKNILAQAAEELYDQLETMHARFFHNSKNVPLMYHGAVLERSPVGDLLRSLLRRRSRNAYALLPPAGSPLDGAMRLLRRTNG